MGIHCWKCARCGALSRTWNGVLRFARPGNPKVGCPVCIDAAACRARAQREKDGEVWLDESGDEWEELA